jgi:hypothetical protein
MQPAKLRPSLPSTRRLVAVLLATLLLMGFVPESNTASDFIRGDTNASGEVDMSDAIATLLFLFTGGFVPAVRMRSM